MADTAELGAGQSEGNLFVCQRTSRSALVRWSWLARIVGLLEADKVGKLARSSLFDCEQSFE